MTDYMYQDGKRLPVVEGELDIPLEMFPTEILKQALEANGRFPVLQIQLKDVRVGDSSISSSFGEPARVKVNIVSYDISVQEGE